MKIIYIWVGENENIAKKLEDENRQVNKKRILFTKNAV